MFILFLFELVTQLVFNGLLLACYGCIPFFIDSLGDNGIWAFVVYAILSTFLMFVVHINLKRQYRFVFKLDGALLILKDILMIFFCFFFMYDPTNMIKMTFFVSNSVFNFSFLVLTLNFILSSIRNSYRKIAPQQHSPTQREMNFEVVNEYFWTYIFIWTVFFSTFCSIPSMIGAHKYDVKGDEAYYTLDAHCSWAFSCKTDDGFKGRYFLESVDCKNTTFQYCYQDRMKTPVWLSVHSGEIQSRFFQKILHENTCVIFNTGLDATTENCTIYANDIDDFDNQYNLYITMSIVLPVALLFFIPAAFSCAYNFGK